MDDTLKDELVHLVRGRRSLRRYTDRPVPREMITDLLNAAIWAPSAHNRQPWRFVGIETTNVKIQLAAAMGARLRQDLTRDGVDQEVIEKDVTRSYERITSAPVLVLLCLSMQDMDHYTDIQRQSNERLMAVQSVAMAGQNLLLAAHAYGLGACWMCAPLFCPDVVKHTLEIPDDWEPQGLITLGFPAQVRETTRNPLEMSVLWR